MRETASAAVVVVVVVVVVALLLFVCRPGDSYWSEEKRSLVR